MLRSIHARSSIFCLIMALFFIITAALPAMAGARKIKVLTIGDSITSALRYQTGYRYWLWKLLVSAGLAESTDFVGTLCGVGDDPHFPDCGDPPYPPSEWDWDHEGRAATATSQLMAFLPSVLATAADVFLIHYGTNDFLIQGSSTQVPVNNLSKVIDSIRVRNPRATVLLAQIIPYIGYFSDSIPVLNQKLACMAAAKTTAASPIVIVDHYTGYDPSSLNSMDRVHPSDDGYEFIANRWYPALNAALQAAKRVTVTLNEPRDTSVVEGNLIPLRATATAGTGVKQVAFYANTRLVGTGERLNDSVFVCNTWRPGSVGVDTIRARVIDNRDSAVISNSAIVRVTTAPALELPIMQIQGYTYSPYAGKKVLTSGIITGVTRDSAFFWIQDPAGDANDMTSDGVRIDRAAVTYFHPRCGDSVAVRGIVRESQTATSLSTTSIAADSVALLAGARPLPGATPVSYIPPAGVTFEPLRLFMNRHDGMLFKIVNGQVFSPSAANGDCSIIPPSNPISYLSPRAIPPVQPDPVSGVNYLPPVIPVSFLLGPAPSALQPGNPVSNCVGILNYDIAKERYAIAPLPDSFAVSPGAPPLYPVSRRSSSYAGSLRITTVDLGELFDTLDAPLKSDPVSSPAEYAVRLEKLKKAFISELLLPHIACVQSCENQAILADLAARINTQSSRGYKAVSYESADPRGLENGFLYDTLSIRLEQAKPYGTGLSNERQPIIGSFIYGWTRILVANIDLAGRQGDAGLFGSSWPPLRPSETARSSQATRVRQWMDSTLAAGRDSLIIVTGQMNSYPFAEPGAAANNAAMLLRGDIPAGKIRFVSAGEFSYNPFTHVEEGRANQFSYLFLSPALARFAKGADILHYNAGWPEDYSLDPATSVRAGRSDPVEVRF